MTDTAAPGIQPRYRRTDLQQAALRERRVPRDAALPQQLLRSSLIQSKQGFQQQMAFPAHCLLNLQQLNQEDEGWHSFTPRQRENLLKQLRLQSLPALPGLLPMPLCVDLTHLDTDWIFIESGEPQWLLRFSYQEFVTLLELSKTPRQPFSFPLFQTRPNLDTPQTDEDEIRQAVESITQKRVRARLSEAIEIAPLPLSLQQLLKLSSSEGASTNELAKVIETDPSLASQIISWANSPYYGAPGRVNSITDAVIRVLGYDLTMSLALGLGLSRHMQLPQDGVHGYQNFWRDALMHALLMEKLAKTQTSGHKAASGMAYLCGLLHNFGYLVLAEIFPPHFSLYCRNQEVNPHVPPMFIERFLFGITREQIASYLFTTWGMPPILSLAIRQQHNPHYHGPHYLYANLLCLCTASLHPQAEQQLARLPNTLFEQAGILRQQALDARQALDRQSADMISELMHLLEPNRVH